MILITHPYDSKLSKNSRLAQRSSKSREKREAAKTIGMQLLQARRAFVPTARVYLGLVLFRTHRRTDPQNLVELVADAVSEGVGIDDSAFTIVTWPVDLPRGKDAFFLIWLTQDRAEYLRAIASESVQEIVSMSEVRAQIHPQLLV